MTIRQIIENIRAYSADEEPMNISEFCSRCAGYCSVADPQRKWWQFWKTVQCSVCDGMGIKPHCPYPKNTDVFPRTGKLK